ncbi:MAG: ATP synthase F1 subunit gamma [Armatimonadota bacterium]|nr:MAG: ATP synthase F1 subunit gamma [Armatimonadota bacterium]
MLSTRDVKRKIRGVRNIEQITRAMKTVASVRLRRAEARVRAARPYADKMAEILTALGAPAIAHPLLQQREVRSAAVIVVSGDRGLCGAYNHNVIRHAAAVAAQAPQVHIVPLGRKANDFLRRAGYSIRDGLSPLRDPPEFADVAAVADAVGELYAKGECDSVQLVYTRHMGGQASRLVAENLLPIATPEAAPREFIYEPAAPLLLDQFLPRFIRTRVWTAVLDAQASEHSARLTAMTLATDNAEEMIQSLTLEYNKARQASITGELLDIVGTAEALA